MNFVSLSLCIGLLVFLGFREYNASILEQDLEALQQRISASRAANDRAVRLSTEFQREARHLEQVVAFMDKPILAHEIFLSVAAARPRPVLVTSFSLTPFREGRAPRAVTKFRITVQGTVSETPDRAAAEVINDFRSALAAAPELAVMIEENRLSNFVRTDNPSVFTFNIQVVLDPQKQGSNR
ncbi:MAG: hypothetical protein JJT96_03095 [Opitutales bacterium]|nr:hypothetical protein [Opitutales bacterium]